MRSLSFAGVFLLMPNFLLAQATFEAPEKILGPEWVHDQPLYEVSIDRASSESTFKGFQKQIPLLKELGVGVIWLQPIHQRGSFRVDKDYIDSLGGAFIPVPLDKRIKSSTSPYNIYDYYSVNPNYGSKQDFNDLVETIHENGMYVILDLVINHTGWDHVFIKKHPEFYLRNEKGAVKYTAPWKDIAQLDYSRKDVWKYMEKLINHWINKYDIDGFRTDVADRFPAEFWNWIKPRITKNKEIFLLAEGDGPKLYPSHSMTYDWFLAPAFWSIVHGKRNASVITDLLQWEQKHYPEGYRKLRHATNHDVQGKGYAWPSMTQYFDQAFDRNWYEEVSLNEKFGAGLETFMVLCVTLPNGQPMIWTGQEYGIIEETPRTIPFGKKKVQPFYKKLFDLYRNHPSLIYGSFEEIPIEGMLSSYAFRRETEKEKITVFANISDKKMQIPFSRIGIEKEALDFFEQKRSDSSTFTVSPWGYKVFVE